MSERETATATSRFTDTRAEHERRYRARLRDALLMRTLRSRNGQPTSSPSSLWTQEAITSTTTTKVPHRFSRKPPPTAPLAARRHRERRVLLDCAPRIDPSS
ncbi:uncharacterized protein LOC105183052 [Harpegnathos saltator]|uniref:uncharacterized protein LOC105183052 n=1 Tax=Harpegnathos saltator TaxID=610380 RepID=UPI00058BF84A|nr:uncharacterized protein LOC105183052 [Harpegnathos saltator]